jgi:hypothetical protein
MAVRRRLFPRLVLAQPLLFLVPRVFDKSPLDLRVLALAFYRK